MGRTEENPLMKTLIVAFIISTALLTSPSYGGKHVKMCPGENGNAYVTDIACPEDTVKEGTFYAPNAQGYHQEWSPAQDAMLQKHEQRIQKNLAGRNRDPAEVCGVAGGGVHQGQERDPPCSRVWGAQAQLRWAALLGPGLFCLHSGSG